jgi:hypothetical protein
MIVYSIACHAASVIALPASSHAPGQDFVATLEAASLGLVVSRASVIVCLVGLKTGIVFLARG